MARTTVTLRLPCNNVVPSHYYWEELGLMEVDGLASPYLTENRQKKRVWLNRIQLVSVSPDEFMDIRVVYDIYPRRYWLVHNHKI